MVREVLNRLLVGESLSSAEAREIMRQIMDEEMTPIQLAGILTALRAKGETSDEVVGFATTMRDRARGIAIPVDVADTCGTGGDGRGTFNISTAAALVLAGAGQPVAKHGNRAASGKCGSADVLEAVGVDVALPPDGVARCIAEAGIGFLFAPAFHPATKYAGQPRRELGVRTVFNLLGPLTNPARPRYQLVGVSSADLLDLIAESLLKLGVEAALVVHSEDGLDEISVSGPTAVREVRQGAIRAYEVTPADFGLPASDQSSILGGDPDTNAAMLRAVLDGQGGGPRDATLMNAAAALYIAGRVPDLREGVALAGRVIDSGAARATLDRLRIVSQGARMDANSAA